MNVAGDVNSLREDDLEDVSGRDVLPRRLHHLQISFPRGVRRLTLFSGLLRELTTNRHGWLLGAKARDEFVNPAFGTVVRLAQAKIVVERDMGHSLDRSRQVIEHQ